MSNTRSKLPRLLETYLNERVHQWDRGSLRLNRNILVRFHDFLDDHGYCIESLTKDQLTEHAKVIADKALAPCSRRTYLQVVSGYVTWIFSTQQGHLDPLGVPGGSQKRASGRIEVALPRYADEFLALIATSKKRDTCSDYRTQVKHLHYFIAANNIDVASFGETEMVRFLDYIADRKIGITARRSTIIRAKTYIGWLFDRGLVTQDPAVTLRKLTLPRSPKALPRPLSAVVDELFQNEFLTSNHLVTRGLYVMRHTGIRIGELKNLSYDCVRYDLNGQPHLKVPLGKLNEERLVPLTPAALAIIKSIQQNTLSRTPEGSHPAALFIGKNGRPVRRTMFHSAFSDIKLKLVLSGRITEVPDEPIVAHRLRHTFATTLLTGGINIVVLQKLLGHRSIQMTLRYASVVPTKVVSDYFAALKTLGERAYLDAATDQPQMIKIGHRKLVADLITVLKKQSMTARTQARRRKISKLIDEVTAIGRDIGRL